MKSAAASGRPSKAEELEEVVALTEENAKSNTIGNSHLGQGSASSLSDSKIKSSNSVLASSSSATGHSSDSDGSDSTLVIIGCMLLNFWSAVFIIWTNKWVMLQGFKWTSILTWLHFIASYIGLEICQNKSILGENYTLFEPKYVAMRKVGPLVCSFIAFVIFNNLSLQYNTVGVYQLLKVMMTPVIVCLQYFLYKMTLTPLQTVALIPICIGVSLATISSLKINGFFGLFYGICGIFSTSLYQIWVKTEQKNLDLNPYQLLHNQSFLSIFLLAPIALTSDADLPICIFTQTPKAARRLLTMSSESILASNSNTVTSDSISDSDNNWFTNIISTGKSMLTGESELNAMSGSESLSSDTPVRAIWNRMLAATGTSYSTSSSSSSPSAFSWLYPDCDQVLYPFQVNSLIIPGVFASCCLAFLVNLSTFLVIGKTSPVSYQVLGHSKLFVIMLSAFLMFGDIPNAQNLIGASMALGGIFWYTYLKM